MNVMKKRLILVALTILLFMTASTTTLAASGKCGRKVQWKLKNGVLTISGKGKMKDYYFEAITSPPPWYNYRSEIKKIVVKKGITRIGSSAFSECTKVKNVKIAGTVKSIGDYAFYKCKSLKSLTIPEGVKKIEGYGLASCRKLKKLILPKSLVMLDGWVFYNTRSLKAIYFHGNRQQWETIISDPDEVGQYASEIVDDIQNVTVYCN